MKNKAYWLIGLLLVAVLAGCGGELYDECDEDDDACWEMLEAEFDEEYDDEFDGEDDEYDDEAGWGWDYVETAEDCYEDEYFDEADQLCYPNWEDEDCDDEDCFADEGGIFSFFEGLLGTGIGGSYGEFDEAGNSAIISYQIEGNQLVNPERGEGDDPAGHAENVEVHQQIWERFIRLIPAQNRAVFVKFVIFTDGPEEIMAAVEPVEEGDLSRWVLAVDIEDIADVDDLNYTLIHEYAHVMTLDDSQVASGVTSESCDEYALFEGCALPRAYLNAFYEKFWADVFAELGVSSEDELTEDMMVDYYEENEDSFVTDYASTNPGEDIAESFTVFVLQPKPAGDTIAEQKVLFFYDYPELVRLRGDIASRLFSRMRRQAAGE